MPNLASFSYLFYALVPHPTIDSMPAAWSTETEKLLLLQMLDPDANLPVSTLQSWQNGWASTLPKRAAGEFLVAQI